jgi:hypothetical protein
MMADIQHFPQQNKNLYFYRVIKMPNGGVLPCCQVCQYARKLEKLGNIYCQRHRLQIHLSLATFCAALSNEASPGLAHFIYENNFQSGVIFQWLEITYQDAKHPQLPQYYHEPTEVGSIEEYRNWTEKDATAMSQRLHAQKREELGKG